MNKLKVVCAQFKPKIGGIDFNLNKIELLYKKAMEYNPNIIVFPELCIQGVCSPEILCEISEVIPGYSSNIICELSKKYNIYSVVGISEKNGDRYYNSSMLINNNGNILGVYRKVHLWDAENRFFSNGREYLVYNTDFGKAAMWICYDTRFPEVARVLALKGARISFVPTAWLSRDVKHWKKLLSSRGLENFMYVCGADEIVDTDLHQAIGASTIVNPEGDIISEAKFRTEGLIYAELDLNIVDNLRSLIPIFKDRQKNTYGELLL